MPTKWINAARKGDVETILAMLLDGQDLEERDDFGYTALMQAALCGRIGIVQILLTEGADVHAHANGGENALVSAAYTNHHEIARLLLDHGIDPNIATSPHGYSALVCAAMNGSKKFMEVLIQAGADTFIGDDLRKDLIRLHAGPVFLDDRYSPVQQIHPNYAIAELLEYTRPLSAEEKASLLPGE